MKYRMVCAHDNGELCRQVNDLISQGWKPQGGVSVAYRSGSGVINPLFSQAMILKSLEDQEE